MLPRLLYPITQLSLIVAGDAIAHQKFGIESRRPTTRLLLAVCQTRAQVTPEREAGRSYEAPTLTFTSYHHQVQ